MKGGVGHQEGGRGFIGIWTLTTFTTFFINYIFNTINETQ